MPTDLEVRLDRAYEDLRGIDSELTKVTGRTATQSNGVRRVSIGNGGQVGVYVDNTGDRNTRRRVNVEPAYDSYSHGASDRRVQDVGNRRRIVISTDNNGDEYDRKRTYNDYDNEPPLKKTLQSSVVMPTIESKSREATITELKKNTTKDDTTRNRRMFSNLLVGTLRQFQKEENSGGNRVQSQIEKQREIERRLEMTEKEEKNKMLREKEALLSQRREKEQEILKLKRKKAIMLYAEEKEKHLRRLQCFIQTQTKPPLFFLPAKHTLRTLELLKESAKKVDMLIELRRNEMARELHQDSDVDSDSDDNIKPGALRSAVAIPVSKSMSTDQEPSTIREHDGSNERSKDGPSAENGGEKETESKSSNGDESDNKKAVDANRGKSDKNGVDEQEQDDVEIDMET